MNTLPPPPGRPDLFGPQPTGTGASSTGVPDPSPHDAAPDGNGPLVTFGRFSPERLAAEAALFAGLLAERPPGGALAAFDAARRHRYGGARVLARTASAVTYRHRFEHETGAARSVTTRHTAGVDDVGGLCPPPARRN